MLASAIIKSLKGNNVSSPLAKKREQVTYQKEVTLQMNTNLRFAHDLMSQAKSMLADCGTKMDSKSKLNRHIALQMEKNHKSY
jgi:hypothetical protein